MANHSSRLSRFIFDIEKIDQVYTLLREGIFQKVIAKETGVCGANVGKITKEIKSTLPISFTNHKYKVKEFHGPETFKEWLIDELNKAKVNKNWIELSQPDRTKTIMLLTLTDIHRTQVVYEGIKKGLKAKDIAKQLPWSVHHVYFVSQDLKKKVGVNNIWKPESTFYDWLIPYLKGEDNPLSRVRTKKYIRQVKLLNELTNLCEKHHGKGEFKSILPPDYYKQTDNHKQLEQFLNLNYDKQNRFITKELSEIKVEDN